jgi:hypothetical protein
MQKLLLFSFLVVSSIAKAQNVPWAGAPAEKRVLSVYEETDEGYTPVYLKLDTLHRSTQPDERDRVSQWWYGTEAVGYGYVDKQGRPYGVWKYYTPANNSYQLHCEGYYTVVSEENLSVDPEIQKQFRTATSTENKAAYIAALPNRFLFTGEWRFYKAGKLQRIAVLGNEATIPYEVMMQPTADGGAVSSYTLVWAQPQRRLAGQVLTTADLTVDGYLRVLRSPGYTLEFDPKGKPVIPALYNGDEQR